MARRRDFEALATTEPAFADVDPEDDGFDESTAAAAWSRRSARPSAASGSSGRATGERSVLRAAIAVDDDPKYAGRVVSVADLRRERRSGGPVAAPAAARAGARRVPDVDGDDEEGSDDEEGTDDESGDSEGELVGAGGADDSDGDEAGSGGTSDVDDDDDGGSESSDGDEPRAVRKRGPPARVGGANDGDDGDDLDAELAALASADASMLSKLNVQGARDAESGRIVRSQLLLGGAFVESRLLLQRAMGLSARLPPADALDALAARAPPLTRARAAAVGELKSLLGGLLQTRAHVLSAVPEVAAAVTAGAAAGRVGGVKRPREGGEGSTAAAAAAALLPPGLRPWGVGGGGGGGIAGAGAVGPQYPETVDAAAAAVPTDALWASLEAGWAAAGAWRDATLDGWARKLAFAGGKLSEKRAGSLKSLAAPLSAQVAALLATSGARLRERAVVAPSAAARVLGVPPRDGASTAGTGTDGGGVGAAAPGDDVCVYDDADFLATLLRDVTSSAAGASGGASASAALAAAAAAASLKAGYTHSARPGAPVDRKASKGRRARYVVHPKLVAFGAPAPYAVPPDLLFDLDTVCASLFKSLA